MSKFCMRCGTDLPRGADFCPRCGNATGNKAGLIKADQANDQRAQQPYAPPNYQNYNQEPAPPVNVNIVNANVGHRKRGGCLKTLIIGFAALIGISIAIAAFATTGNKADNRDRTASTPPVSSQPAQGQQGRFSGLNQPIELTNLKITALDIQSSYNADSYFAPEDGNVFIGVQFEIENISNSDQIVSTVLLFDIYVDDILSSYSLSANLAFGDGTLDGTISPQKKMVGWMAVEAPDDATEIELHVKGDWLSKEKAVFVLNVPK